jgi:hypothetical protein
LRYFTQKPIFMTELIGYTPLPEVRLPAKLIPFNVPIMNHEEDNTQREERYRISQDDVSIIRKEVNKLTQVVGDLTQAIRGNDFGNDGLLKRLETVEETADMLKKRIEDVVQHAKSRETYVRIIWGLICFVFGTIFVAIIDRLIPSKK